ncbi:MAG: hypothetical protein MSA15_20435 [Clostridium sp.]|nr:hypothetical protein [Clostridium sp.]
MKLNKEYTYGELTKEILNEEPKKGGSKTKQMRQIESLYKVEQNGRKYILVEKYDTPKEIKDNRGKTKKDYPQYAIEDKYDKSIGVYKIVLDNQIYIGSTKVGFRERFIAHVSKFNTLPTKEMLDNGATFEILQICNEMSENEIRHIENNYIEEYRNNPNWIVVNERKNVGIKGEGFTKDKRQCKNNKPKYTKVRINKNDLNRAMELLKDNGIDFKL